MFFGSKNKLRSVDTSGLVVIQCGREIPETLVSEDEEGLVLYEEEKNKWVRLMTMLEKNESYIYWFQPIGSKNMDEQIPALKSQGKFYMLSLRMMKAIWRHVRLKKDFKNVERAQSGGFKLKIPWALWTEKKRTQIRFNAMQNNPDDGMDKDEEEEEEEEETGDNNNDVETLNITKKQQRLQLQQKDSKKTCASAASKISKIINDFFFPMLDTGQIRRFTVFDAVNVYDTSLVDFVALQDRRLVESKCVFLSHLEKLYDVWKSEH